MNLLSANLLKAGMLHIEGLPAIRVADIIDILLVAVLIYEIYKLVRGTNVMRIFWAIVIIYITWLVVSFFHMRLSTEILGQFISIGIIAIIIVFQPEIRRFLLLIGTKTSMAGDTTRRRLLFWRRRMNDKKELNFDAYVQACMHMSQSRTGALIVFARQNDVSDLLATGQSIEAPVSAPLIEALFFKNSPLHDGAVIVRGETILAARCILPVSSNRDIATNLGLRHRSGIGVTEQTDVISVIVSEETGAISYAVAGVLYHDVTPVQLRQFLEQNIF